jgi:KUP system potassium uptake protein
MPQWLILPGIIISLFASLVACHSMVGRSFTLVSEAVSLNFWPNIKILHPTQFKGQVYLPLINWIFWLASTIFVIIFRRSSDMVAAYGLAVIIVMIATTLLLIIYYRQYKKGKRAWLAIVPVVLIIETSFFVSITYGFASSIWFSLIIISLSVLIMIGWYFGRKIKNRYITFANLSDYTSLLIDLHNDKSVPMIATNLVYIIKANRMDQVESKVIYSIFKRQPKRAETYWFLHVDRTDEPERFDYEFNPIIPGVLHRIDFHIGFKVEPRINLYFREVLDDLVHSGEINLTSSFNSLRKFNFTGDFKYILIDRVMLRDNKLSALENFILSLHGLTRWLDITDERALHLDLTNTIVEKIPVTLEQPPGQRITRIK